MQWISENMGSLVVAALVILAVVLAVIKLAKDRRAGKSIFGCGSDSCSGNCGSCSKNTKGSDKRKEI